MKNTLGWLVVFLCWSPGIFAASLPADWKNVQTLELPKPGAFRFRIPTETLNACRDGLGDLRFYDDAGRELPYLIEFPDTSRPPILPGRNFEVTTSAGKMIITFSTRTDRPVRGVNLLTPLFSLQKNVMIEGTPDGKKWIVLAKDEPIFRETSGASRLLVEFPPTVCEELRVTIDQPPGSARTTISGAEIHTAPIAQGETAPLELTIVERENKGGKTRLKLRSPMANFTLAELAVHVTDTNFTRTVRLASLSPNGAREQENEIWHETIFRRPGTKGSTAAKLNITPNVACVGHDLILTIENGDQSALNVSSVTASYHPVSLVVLVSASGTYHLLSGNPTATPPSYDLSAVPPSSALERLNSVTTSSLIQNPAHRAPQAANKVDPNTGNWRFRKKIEVNGGELQEVELDLDVMTHSLRSLNDVRVTCDGKPIPFAIKVGTASASITPSVTKEEKPTPATTDRWNIQLPRSALPLTQLECSTEVNSFRRYVQLIETQTNQRGEKADVTLGNAVWIRASSSPVGRMSITVTDSPHGDRLVLTTDHAGNASIPLKDFNACYPTAHLIFKASPGAATYLYYGNGEATAPPQDNSLTLELAASQKTSAKLGREEAVKIRQPLGH